MTSILKNQLLKHLSRYTKNLSSDKINISTFRGEGELSNLQLDENVLTELLELPSWLRLTSAWCNHVSFRIHWTKLKSTPIILTLDEVKITVETCELGDRTLPASDQQALNVPQGKYSFINKIIDGITIVVNNVNVNFISPAFSASIQMSRIRVESRTPKWLLGDLRVTRLKDPTKRLLLIFKEISWQTVRIEASSTQDKTLTPLRLLTNQARCRITIKKKLADCSVISSRLVIILDDLLWVLTDSQLKAALHFVDSLSGLIKASHNVTQRTKAQRKLETLPEYQALLAQQLLKPEEQNVMSVAQKSYNIFDIQETSYHFFSQRIDLHLCDDAGDGRSCHPVLKDGGALQVSVLGFQVDYYPYHLAKSNRASWPKYKEATIPPAMWLEQSLNSFKEALLNLSNPNRPSPHAPLERTPNYQHQPHSPNFSPTFSGEPTMPTTASNGQSSMKNHVLNNLAKLMTSCVIVKIEDFTLYRVTTSGKKQMPKEFISSDKERYSCPPDLPALHAELTYFYYPGDFVFPLPPTKVFVHVNPVQVHFELESFLWFSSFALNLHESLLRTSVVNTLSTPSPISTTEPEPNIMYMDVKMEAIMPTIIFEAAAEVSTQRDRPKTMQIQIARFAITNIREMGSSRADLAQALQALQEGSLVFASDFPSKEGDMCIVTDRLLSHVSASDVFSNTPIFGSPQLNKSSNPLTRYALWTEPRDVWCVKLDPVWIDFLGARSIGANRSIPFVDTVPITLWIHGKSPPDSQLEHILDMQKQHDFLTKVVYPECLVLSVASLQSLESDLYKINNLDKVTKSQQDISLDRNFDDMEKKKYISDVSDEDVNTSDLHIIAHVANLVSLQIDHYQYLFLLRLSDELTELSTFLSLDSKRILNTKNSNKSIVIGCVVPQVEVTLVMPSQTPGKESSGCDGESVLPDSASLGDDLHMNSASTGWPTTTPTSLDLLKNNNPFGSVESPSPITNDPPFEMPHTSNPNTHGYNVQIQSEPVQATATRIDREIPGTSKSRNRNSQTDTSFSKEINSGLLSMKKGFSNFMTSIDSALKTNTTDDISDTYSLHSDLSSDSENYVMVLGDSDKTADCMDVMFKLNPFTIDNNLKASPVEVASEVYEEQQYKTNMSSPSEPSEASSCKRRDLVSMVTFKLTTVEIIRQNQGYSSSTRIQVGAINCDECGAIPWDEFQSKFGTRCRAWNIAPYNPELPPVVQLRLEEELQPPEITDNIIDRKSVLSWFSHNLDVKIKNLSLQLSVSTVIGLGDLAEDEIFTKSLPLEVSLENVCLHVIEDRPPVNITSPGSIPIDLTIGKMNISRDDTGMFYIQREEKSNVDTAQSLDEGTLWRKGKDRELLTLQLVMQQLKLDNENLRKQLSYVEKYSESNKMKTKQETDLLKNYLKSAQDNISNLLDEKRTLLDTVKSLQSQLSSFDTTHKHHETR